MTALGFIETKGLVGAIEAADAMLKAADVRLLEKNLAGGGLVTISVAGEVAAVSASVDAGVASLQRIPGTCLVSRHVIARPDAELAAILVTEPPATPGEHNGPQQDYSQAEPAPQAAPKTASAAQTAVSATGQSTGQTAAKSTKAPQRHGAAQLKKMNVNKLREIAQATDGLAMNRESIAKADKKALVEAILAAYRQTKE